MATKTFGNKVGTPRGYVDKAARDKVDEAMQPIAEVGKELLYLTPMGRGARGAKAIYEGGKALVRGTTKQATKKVAKEVAKDTTKALEYKPSIAMDTAKTAEKVVAKGAKMTPGRQRLMNTLEKSRQAGAKARNTFRKDSGTMSSRVDKAKATRPSTPRDGEKFGALVKRGDNLPAKQGSRSVVPYKEGSKGVTKYKPQAGSLAKIGTKVGDKGSGGRLGNILKYGAVGAAVGGAGYGLYQGADNPKAAQGGGGMKYAGPAGRDDRASSGGGTFKPINRDNLSDNGKKTFDAKQGQKKKPVVKKDGPKAGPAKKADKPMSSFERMKKRQYEKEGFGGRSLTSRGAESRVKKERSYKFKDLFKKKK
jgi:hypothetical protein